MESQPDVPPSDVAPSGSPNAHGDAPLDLLAVERDLAGVELALERLDDGSYWSDELTGEPIPDDVLAADPVARRAAPDPPR